MIDCLEPSFGQSLGLHVKICQDSCASSAPHSDLIQSWLADIHRISRQDSANMAHGDWPSKHSKLHTLRTLSLADQQASTNTNFSPLLSPLCVRNEWQVRCPNMLIIRQGCCCVTVYTDNRCWWGGGQHVAVRQNAPGRLALQP